MAVRPRWALRVGLALGLGLLAIAGGCEDKISLDTYEQIQAGMPMHEVERLLGAGEKQTSGGYGIGSAGLMTGSSSSGSDQQTFLWKSPSGGKHILVVIKDGKVISKSQFGLQ